MDNVYVDIVLSKGFGLGIFIHFYDGMRVVDVSILFIHISFDFRVVKGKKLFSFYNNWRGKINAGSGGKGNA